MSSEGVFVRGGLSEPPLDRGPRPPRSTIHAPPHFYLDQATPPGSVISGHTPRHGATPQSSSDSSDRGPPTTDAYYKQKLRSGFIDLRNSYNEKLKPRSMTYTRALTAPGSGYSSEGSRSDGRPQPVAYLPGTPARRTLAERRALYRSNSSLELDQLAAPTDGALHRDYGSASSLDLFSPAASGESFFAMLQDYRNTSEADQRAPAPPAIHDVLRGQADLDGGSRMMRHVPLTSRTSSSSLRQPTPDTADTPRSVVNGNVDDDSPTGEGANSPKLKSKSQKQKERKLRSKSMVTDQQGGGGGGTQSGGGGGGLFRKFLGKSESETKKAQEGEGGEGRSQDERRAKAFTHYDCQSVSVSLADVRQRRLSSGPPEAGLKLRNTTTGASQASGARLDDVDDEDEDPGDGRSNDLVRSCPFFRNELGGEEERTVCLNRRSAQRRVQQLLGNTALDAGGGTVRAPVCNAMAVLDTSPGPHGPASPSLPTVSGLVLEYLDHGALYYRHFFHGVDHQNYFGVDESVGPVAVSIRREKLDESERETMTGQREGAGHCYQYRLIVRTSELSVLRGSVLEEAIPSSSRLSLTRGLPAKDVLEWCVPHLSLSGLKLATAGPKTSQQLLQLDEQGIVKTYKFGVMLCRAGQSSEEEMYNNEHSTPAFDEFLDCIGQRVRLLGFDKYRGGLDCKTDTTGLESVYTELGGYEVMLHVATLLPYTPTNRQQLPRKRHIGNDIVTIVFQEPGALPFTPQSVRSHFQHVFIIVRAHHPNTDHTTYSLAVTRSKDVPPFGPLYSEGALFNKSPEFAQYLLVKAINGENAVHRSDKFIAMATRTRQEYLKELATNHVTSTTLESTSRLSKFTLGSGRKKDRPKQRTVPDLYTRAALVWRVQVEDFGRSCQTSCFLAIGAETVLVVDTADSTVLLATPCKSVLGWTLNATSVRLYINQGECVVIRAMGSEVGGDLREIVNRLQLVTSGCDTQELTLRRNSVGQLGFHVHHHGLVSDIERHGHAWDLGMRDNCRLVEVCKVAMATLTHDQLIDLLRTSVTVRVVVIPPLDNGTARRWLDSSPPSTSRLFSHTSHDDTVDLSPVTSHVLSPNHFSSLTRLTSPETRDPVPRAEITQHSLTNLFSDGGSQLGGNHDNVKPARTPHSAHAKQLSHDSLGSRSSGGRGSEGRQSSGGLLERVSDEVQQLWQSHGWPSSSQPHFTPDNTKGSQPDLSTNETPRTRWPAHISHSNPALHETDPPPDLPYYSQHRPASPDRTDDERRPLLHYQRDEPARAESEDEVTPPRLPARRNTAHTPSTQRSVQEDLRRLINPDLSPDCLQPGGYNGATPRSYQDYVGGGTLQRNQNFEGGVALPRNHSGDGGGTLPWSQVGGVTPLWSQVGGVTPLRTQSEESLMGVDMRGRRGGSQRRTPPRPPTPPPRDDSRDTRSVFSSRPMPLPDCTSQLRWNDLVDTATRAINRSTMEPPHSSQQPPQPLQPPLSQLHLSASVPGDMTRSMEGRLEESGGVIQALQERVTELERQRDQEREGRVAVDSEVTRLREENLRLQEESQAAAAQLRRFTQWFFNSMEHPPSE